jgi:hypothetical protein
MRFRQWLESWNQGGWGEWEQFFYQTPSPDDPRLDDFERWLRNNRQRFVTMYHGTTVPKEDILYKGLLPTSATRRRSYQSSSGYVCLSVYQNMAQDFARMGDPMHADRITVWAVEIAIGRLLPDLDQLANKRMGGVEVEDKLSHSLIYGSGARVKGKIDPMQIHIVAGPI